ncbi:MAG: hypothetical protein HY291_16620 [Planctomycetes bacterium]|nr:hypothetical protein [Planctomycetota bacterium]
MTIGLILEILITPIGIGLFCLGFFFADKLGIGSSLVSGIVCTWMAALVYGAPKIHRIFAIKKANLKGFIESSWPSWLILILVAGIGSWLIRMDGIIPKSAGFALLIIWLALNTGAPLVFRETIRILWQRTRPLGLLSVLGLIVSTTGSANVGWLIAFAAGILLTLIATFLGFHGLLETWWSFPETVEKDSSQQNVSVP